MGTLLTLLTLGGLGGLGWWVATRDDDTPPRPGTPLALPPPAAAEDPVELPPPHGAASEAKGEQPNGTRYVAPRYTAAPLLAPPSLAPSDFVHRMRSWLEGSPPPTQIELVAVNLERAGHRETAAQLRALASDRRSVERSGPTARPEVAPADPLEPASPPPAPAGSPGSSPARSSDSSSSTADGSGAPSAPSPAAAPLTFPPPIRTYMGTRELRALASRVASMLRARAGQPTDRRLVRRYQVEARLFPQHGENTSGLYGPVTRDSLARHGVRRPPPPRFRAAVEAAAPRPAAPRTPPPNATARANAPRRPRRASRPSAPRANANSANTNPAAPAARGDGDDDRG